ncbi:MAG: PstS family phosphate ABC transporter substrate-binding protein [bacterium]|nr:PstS family phosphate ABC transporter substrate-binding protein [bacterium]
MHRIKKLTLLLCMAMCACRRISTERSELRGTVKISGAWALYPLVVAWSEQFQRQHPSVRIDVSAGGAGKGMADTLAGVVDLGMVSREIAQEEVSRGARAIPVAKDAVVCIVNAACPAGQILLTQGLTRSQLHAVWLGKEALSWRMFGATTDVPVNVYTRSDAAGAPETWALYLGARQEQLRGTGVYGDPGVVEAVRQDANGIGYCNLNFAYDPSSGNPVNGILVIAIDANENGCVDAEESLLTRTSAQRAIALNIYPSPPARPLYLVAKDRITNPVAAAFVRWALTEGQKLVEPCGYIPLPDSILTNALLTLSQ